ncbi:transmembrane protein KIAA1109 homolog isoform X4 [Kryptolebias marmoratus]|uniref:transmembrane protein KIAA1109 homolog isoform X4 n=1 Tax=Kryptolebias marmoratus TaxID=37003 RepID=UPI0007F91081|nr:transmembrane protein KIAA1109 homolog isoform X4 [Kryptolebias marmoratus]
MDATKNNDTNNFLNIEHLDSILNKHNSNFIWLLVATILSCGWIIYLTYYNSRNIGFILTRIINRLYKDGYIHIGSFSFSVLSGKVMFREVYFINQDMSIRIQDGFLIFRWWKMYNPKQKQHDPKAETRLYVTVNGFEFHVYNRTDLYARLQETFGLEPTLLTPKDEEKGQEDRNETLENVNIQAESPDPTSSWRSLIPVIKVNISTGRLAFGNHHLPQTLCVNFEDAFLTYATKPPSCHLDQFMHIVKGSLENVRVMLVPSPRYLGLQNDEPPRLMGEGFVVMQSNDVDIYYYQDEPGLVPAEQESTEEVETSSEGDQLQDLPPCWGLDIVCGKGTDFNYGPWADRQRDCLWKFFLPADYQPMKVTEVSQPGKPRQIQAFELRMNIIADATIDLLFTKNRETNAIHVNVGAGSYLEVNIPMTVGEDGYSPTIKGQLLHVDTTSSMQYRTLLEAEMLAFHVIVGYPRVWNMPQSWQCEIEVYKATYHFIYAQKNFFTDLIKDWASDSAPDIYSFVPYSWKFKILFHQFEMIWAANQHNWIDCSTKQQENVYLAACGETLNIDFTLPFNEFVPTTCHTRFSLKAEDTDMRLSLPECHPSRYPLLTLAKDYQNIKLPPDMFMSGENQGAPPPKPTKSRWRNITHAEAGWVDCWSVPNFLLIIDYTWHPIYPQKADEQLKQSLSEMEESMLSALRPPEHPSVPHNAPPHYTSTSASAAHSRVATDPSELPPDRLHVEMEMSPDSQILLYGPLLRTLISIKENYFGEDDMYTDFEEAVSSPVLSASTSSGLGWSPLGMEDSEQKEAPDIHPLDLRPWDITVLINLYKVHGRLPVHCSSEGPEGPSGFLERLCFEMKKGYKETMLQMILSPIHIFVSDNYQRPTADGVLRDGHLSLSGLQMRAHAMFSAQGLPLGSDTLEYAWLIDMQAGALTGRVTVPQVASMIEWGETFIFHVLSREFQLEQPKPSVICQHGADRRICDAKLSCMPGHCRTSEELKYTMTRLAMDGVDLFVVEHGCAANVKTGIIRVANCNLHNQAVGEGISAVVQDMNIRQYIEQQQYNEAARLQLAGQGQGPGQPLGLGQPPLLRRSVWLEAGSVKLNLITADIALAADHPAKCEVQRQFLELHDAQTKRLWFLWPDEANVRNKRSRNRCGCLGGCRFFGGTNMGLDYFKLEELTPSSSSAFSSSCGDLDMCYGQSLLQPGEWIMTKETPKVDGRVVGLKTDTHSPSLPPELPERRGQQHLSLQVPQRSHSSASSSEENSTSSAALPLLAGERDSPSPSHEERLVPVNGRNHTDTLGEVPEVSPVSPNSSQDRTSVRSPLCSPLKRQSSVHSGRLGSTKSLSAAVFTDKPPPVLSGGVQFSSEVSRSDENVLDSPRQRRSYGSFPFTPSADSNTFHQYRSADSSMSMADSEAYFSATEDFEPISSADEGPGTYPGRKKKRRQQMQQPQQPPYHMENYSRSSIYHSVEGPLTYVLNGELITEPRPLPPPPILPPLPPQPLASHTSQASFVSALAMEEESSVEPEKTAEPGPVTRQPHVMACYQTYLAHYQVSNWSVKQPTNKRTSKSSLHRPLDLDTPTSEESSTSFDQLSVPSFKVIKQGLSASSLLDRGVQLMGENNGTPYTPLDKRAMENTDEDTTTDDWSLEQPLAQTRTTAIVEVKGAINVVLTPLVAESVDRYIESMVHFASIRHPAAILDDLHGKVLNEAYQISKSTVTESSSQSQTGKQEHKLSKTEGTTPGSLNTSHGQAELSVKPDNVKIKGLQANVSIPKVNLCLLQASVEEGSPSCSSKCIPHVSLVALCFDRIATQFRMNRGIVEETPNTTEHGRPSVMLEKYASATKMQPQSSGSLRSNAGIEKGKEIAARLNVHRIHSQLRGLDCTDVGTFAITAIPCEKSKVLFGLEEMEEFSLVDETDTQTSGTDLSRSATSLEKWGWIMFECGIENLTVKGGRQSGAILYNSFGVMGRSDNGGKTEVSKNNGSTGSQTGSGYSTDVSDDNLPPDAISPNSDANDNTDSDDQDEGVESDDLKKDLPFMPPPPDSSSMKLTIREIWFSFAAPTNVRSASQTISRQLNLLSTATPAIGAWLVPIDQLKSSLRKLDMEGTLRVCAVMGCIMTEALEKKSIHIPIRSKYNRVTKRARYLHENPSCMLCNILHRYLQQADYSIIEEATMNDGVPALVTLKKGLVALARQWMKFIVVTQGFKAIGLMGPNQLTKAKEPQPSLGDTMGLDNGAALQSDTSADGAEFEFDAATVSEHTMLLEGACSRPPPKEVNTGPVSGVEIMRKLSKSHTHSESALRIKGSHPYQSLSYTSGDTAADSPAHVSRGGMPAKDSPRKESLLSNLTGSFRSLHNLLEGTPQRNEPSSATAAKSSSLTRTGTDMLTEHPLLSEPSAVSFYNWMSNAVGNRGGAAAQESQVNHSQHNSLQTGGMCNLPTIPSASDFNTVLSSDQNTLDGTHSQHSQLSTSQEDIVDIEEGNQCPAAVQLADAQVVFKPLLSYTGIQAQDTTPLSYKMYFGEHLSFSGNLECLRADIVDSDTSKERKNKRSRRQGMVNLPPLEFKPALLIETFSVNAVVMEKSTSAPQGPTAVPLSFHDLNRRHYNTFHCDFTTACQAISQRVDMALVRLIHQFSTMIDDIKATQTDIKLNRYTAGSTSPTPTFKARPYRHIRSSDFSRSSRGSLNGANRSGTQTLKSKRGVGGGGVTGGGAGGGGLPPNGPPSSMDTLGRREPRGRTSLGRSERRTSKVSRKGSRDVADHMAIQMDDSDSITVSEQSEPSAECWQNMYKLLNFYSLISDPTGILEKSSPENCLSEGGRRPSEPLCKVIFENEQQEPATPNKPLGAGGRRRSLVSSEPQHVTLIVFGIGMVNRTHLEADIGGLTMEAELKKIHGSFTLKEKMKDILHQKMTETCASAHIGGVNIVLLEGITPDIQLEDFPTSPTSTAKQEFLTVVKCTIAKSQALYSAQRGLKTNNAAVFKVGSIMINIPQHPATLHSMMVRSSHQLSKQISDLIRQPSNVQPPNREDTPTPQPSDKASSINQTPVEANEFPQLPEGLEKKPIVLKFSAMMDGISIGAALLPSLKAEYKMGPMKSHGMTGAQTSFTFELPNHKLCFQSKVSQVDMSTMSPSASLTLPPVTMSGEYIMEDHESHSDQGWAPDDFPAKQGNYLQGNYLRCVAEIGSFEHNLTTDLLNHLVFLQKVFMKEVNEVIQKVSGGEQPIPLWNEHDTSTDAEKPKILLYSLSLMFKGIQMTATTPSMRAVRFETGLIELELSNRIQCKAQPGGSSSYLKLFGKCQVDLNLALGQIVKHQVYEEAGSDFHQVAYFRTRIGLRNALQEEISGSSDKEAVLITLNRPIVFAQPVAFDRAVLFWLNYKAAYDNWNEQRLALNNDIHMATKEVVDKLPGIQQTSAQAFSTLFLQLTVNDLGICLPITNTSQKGQVPAAQEGSSEAEASTSVGQKKKTLKANHSIDFDTGSALVLTIESTLITACSSESLVSKGHFKNFCIRFAEGFETTWDDWKPEIRGDLVMNACIVPDGTYEVCSRTTGQPSAESSSAGTWTLNVLWKMCGIDVHMDPNIGKRLNALGNTLTSLTGEEDVDDITDLNSVNMGDLSDEDENDTMSPTIHMSPESQFSPQLTLRRRLVNHILGFSPTDCVPSSYLNCGSPSLQMGRTRAQRPLSWACETVDPRRQMVMGNQVIDARGRKFSKRVVDIRELNEQAKVIDDLKKLGASEGTINQEIQRYQQLESVAVNDIRRDVRKKLRRSSMRAASLKDKWGLGYKPSYNRSKSISAPAGRPALKRIERQSSRIGDVDDFPDVRVDASSPGPRVTFNIQDTAPDPSHAPVSPGCVFKFPEEPEVDLLSVTTDEPSHLHHVLHLHSPSAAESQRSVFSTPTTPAVFSPIIPLQREDLSSSSSEDSEKEEEFVKPSSYSRPLQASHRKPLGFSAMSQLFTERWPSTPANRSFSGPTSEKNIDFELDVRVEIDSGKCVLHPTTQQPEQEDISCKRSYDHSLKSLDQDSPPKKKKSTSTTHPFTGKKCPIYLQTKSNDLETTVFYIPGVDVKLHYNSKTLKTESPNASRGSSLPRTLSKESKLYGMKDSSPTTPPNAVQCKTNSLLPPQLPPIPSAKGKGSGGVKTAKLYAWVALQTLPEEMVISPCLLDFLEKALETIPITPVERNYAAMATQEEDMGQFDPVEPLEESSTSLVSSSTSAYSSFPVDVVVYVRVQPSQIRFSCLPMSRVECMLKLPSLDLVFSSNRGELETPTGPNPPDGSHPPSSTPPGQHVPKLPSKASPLLGSPLGRTRHSSSQSDLTTPPSTSSGLSFTACMSDFSLYVFHPYGAGKQKSAVTGLPPGPGPLDEEPSSVTGRKDSLSINLEFVKVSLSRMRRTGGPTFIDSFSAKGGKMDTTLINISAVCDIGSASFKYDMRRLSEILAFPRAWYRRSIARRLFLGDQTINLPAASGPATPDSAENITQHLSPESSRKAYWRTWDGSTGSHIPQSPNVFSEHSTGSNMSPSSLGHLKSPAPGRTRSVSDSSAPRRDSVTKTSTPSFSKNGKSAGQQGSPWETLVVFAINLKQLTVQMNMSNVMGNNTWTTSGLKSQGRLSVGSNRDREISMSVGLGRSKLDSKGGVVGGNIDVNTLEMVSHISEHPNQQPSHKIQITMGSTEARVDYMGSSILMGVFSNADLQLQDEWKVNLFTTDTSLSEKSEIFVHGDLHWDIFQVIISRSTTPDLIKIGMKLQEFFTQQFDTSKRALSTWGPGPYLPPKTPVINAEKGAAELYMDAAHHRHWPGVLKVVAGCHISLFQMPLPEDAVQLGGSMSLHGNHMTLACFHGPNFRSKSWALFHLEEPNIVFWTEAQKILEDGSQDDSTYIVQTLDFHLGHNTMVTKPCGALESPMATITKITRRRHENPPHGVATVKEWFGYVTAMRNEELNLLRNVEANNQESGAAAKSSSLLSSFRSSHTYNHETETIFALPRMQLAFKSIHVQDPDEPSLTDPNSKPKVECSMVTEFTDHICVTMDAELIMFLHDLVSAYLKEKEKALFAPRMFATRPGQKSPTALHDDGSADKDKDDSINYTTVDWREFMCNTWHLEPTLRLISWTGRKIDPVGVDYILQKLGFHHARTTIPKWLQRGVMDPLDKVLSVLIKKLGTALQDEKDKKSRDKEEH